MARLVHPAVPLVLLTDHMDPLELHLDLTVQLAMFLTEFCVELIAIQVQGPAVLPDPMVHHRMAALHTEVRPMWLRQPAMAHHTQQVHSAFLVERLRYLCLHAQHTRQTLPL